MPLYCAYNDLRYTAVKKSTDVHYSCIYCLHLFNNTVCCLFLAIIQLTQLFVYMAVIIGGFCDFVSSCCTDPVPLLAPVLGHPCSTSIQLLRCVQITGQQMGTETTHKHRIMTLTYLPSL